MNKSLKFACSPEVINESYAHVLEFGVYTGTTMFEIRSHLPVESYRLYGFDSFLGLPDDWAGTDVKRGAFNLNGVVPPMLSILKNTKIIPGWFNHSIPVYLKEAKDIALLHIDSDIYASAKEILYSDIRLYIKTGTIIVFDEWHYKVTEKEHEQKLFYEWAKDFNIKYELFPTIENETDRQVIKIL